MAYHVSSKGSLTLCKAQSGKCPLGGKHFENETDGMEYLDNLNNKESLIEKFKNAPTPGARIRLRKEIRLLNRALGLEEDADIPVPKLQNSVMSKNSILPFFISILWLFLSIFGPKLSILPPILSIFRLFYSKKRKGLKNPFLL